MNFLQEWLDSDIKLRELVASIGSTETSPEKQARAAFYKISDMFNLHKFPDEITDDDYEKYEIAGIDEPKTVFEETGVLRYLEPKGDPRGIVFCALFNVKNRSYTDMEECARKHSGAKKKIPPEYVYYFTGDDIDSKLNFLQQGESWNKPGVRYAGKVVKV